MIRKICNILPYLCYTLVSLMLTGVSIYELNAVANKCIPIVIEDSSQKKIETLRLYYRIPLSMASSIYTGSMHFGFDPVFVAELILSESGFRHNAVSPKGYKGLMQTPTSTGYTEADVMHGLAILNEKYKQYGPDPVKVVAAYKGGVAKQEAIKQAYSMISSYRATKRVIGI